MASHAAQRCANMANSSSPPALQRVPKPCFSSPSLFFSLQIVSCNPLPYMHESHEVPYFQSTCLVTRSYMPNLQAVKLRPSNFLRVQSLKGITVYLARLCSLVLRAESVSTSIFAKQSTAPKLVHPSVTAPVDQTAQCRGPVSFSIS